MRFFQDTSDEKTYIENMSDEGDIDIESDVSFDEGSLNLATIYDPAPKPIIWYLFRMKMIRTLDRKIDPIMAHRIFRRYI